MGSILENGLGGQRRWGHYTMGDDLGEFFILNLSHFRNMYLYNYIHNFFFKDVSIFSKTAYHPYEYIISNFLATITETKLRPFMYQYCILFRFGEVCGRGCFRGSGCGGMW